MKNKVVLTETEKKDIELIKEEIKSRGGMTTQELISCLGAISFEEFNKKIDEKIDSYYDLHQ